MNTVVIPVVLSILLVIPSSGGSAGGGSATKNPAPDGFQDDFTNLYIIEVRVCGGDCYGKDASRSAGDNK